MKKYLLFLITLIFSLEMFPQGIYNNGGKIVIGTGVTLYINDTGGNYRNETSGTGGSMDLSGALKITGNITNNVAASDIFSSTIVGSEVAFVGSLAQTVGGTTTATNTFANLTINNTSGVIFSKNAQVNGTMTFTKGLLNIGNNNFTFSASSVIAGTPSATSMIIATGTGQVFRVMTAAGAFTFPVGDNTLSAKYSPVTLNFTSGVFAPGASAGLNLVNGRFNDPLITGSYLNRYWNITQTGITGFTCNATFQYLPADVVGTESNIYTLNISPSPIKSFDLANTSTHMLTASGLTSFGTFTGGPGFRTLNLKYFDEGLYAGNGLMAQTQGLVGNQYPGTVSDQFTFELHDPVTYLTTIWSNANTNLNKDGTAIITVPLTFTGSYYLTIKQRNSISTVSGAPVLLSTPNITYDFSTAATQAFGSNQKIIATGIYGFFAGDVNQDGIIDLSDLIRVGNQAALAGSGYIPEDINGDGLVDLSDIIFVGNNAAQAIGIITP
jgi:hypothetical protein